MKIIILSILAVAMIGLMIPSISAQEQVPDWVKNNAGWWADDQIDDSEFLNAITYLIKNKIINPDDSTYSEFIDYEMQVWENKDANNFSRYTEDFTGQKFYRPPSTHGAEIFIHGDISSWNVDPLERMTVRLVYPDGSKIVLYSSEYKLGKFDTSFNVNFVSALGKYQITATIDNETYNFPSIMLLEDKTPTSSVPAWIKNNAGWWSDGQIPDSAFMQGIQFLINHQIIIIPETEMAAPPPVMNDYMAIIYEHYPDADCVEYSPGYYSCDTRSLYQPPTPISCEDDFESWYFERSNYYANQLHEHFERSSLDYERGSISLEKLEQKTLNQINFFAAEFTNEALAWEPTC